MNVEALKAFCAGFPATHCEELAPPRNVLVYSVGGKPFGYFKLSEPERWRFSLRVTPERFLELTSIPGIKPARYMGRFHWVTLVNVGTVPEAYLKELVTWSYQKAIASLSKARQAELAGQGHGRPG